MTKSILFVEDDQKFRRLMVPGLVKSNYEVVEAESAEEADIQLTARAFSLIIVDGELPAMSGFKWIENLRKAGNQSPIVFVSAHFKDTGSFCDLINKYRVALVLHKPITQAVFVDQIRAMLGDTAVGAVPCKLAAVADIDFFQESLAQLVDEYVLELPTAIADLHALIGRVKTDGEDDDLLKLAIREAHTMSGTSGSYGFSIVGAALGTVEATLREVLDFSTLRWQRDVWTTIENEMQRAIGAIDNAVQSNAPTVSGVQNANIEWTHKRILLLDDDRHFAKRIELVLTGENVMVYSFTDLLRIYSAVERLDPDLVILDLDMPELDGIEICKHIRSEQRWKDLPIVFVSGRSDEISRLRATSAGGTQYITKPINDDDLLRVVRTYLAASDSVATCLPAVVNL